MMKISSALKVSSFLFATSTNAFSKCRHAVVYTPKRFTSMHIVNVFETVSEKHKCHITRDGANGSFTCDNPIVSTTNPSPRELLLASLGSCTAMTIRTFHENSLRTSMQWKNSRLETVHVQGEASTYVNPLLPPLFINGETLML